MSLQDYIDTQTAEIKALKEEKKLLQNNLLKQNNKIEMIEKLDFHNCAIPQTSEAFTRFLNKQKKLTEILKENK